MGAGMFGHFAGSASSMMLLSSIASRIELTFSSRSPLSRSHTRAFMRPVSMDTARPFHIAPSPPDSGIRPTIIWVSPSDAPVLNGFSVLERTPSPSLLSLLPFMKFRTSRSSSRPHRRHSAYILANSDTSPLPSQ